MAVYDLTAEDDDTVKAEAEVKAATAVWQSSKSHYGDEHPITQGLLQALQKAKAFQEEVQPKDRKEQRLRKQIAKLTEEVQQLEENIADMDKLLNQVHEQHNKLSAEQDATKK